MIARHITFIGRVQGVGFRFTARRAANRRQLTGYVRNMPNGSVEMLAQGRPEEVDDCIQDIQEYFYDYIRETSIREISPDLKYADFQITF
jgi:acylphosphatase